LFARAGARRTAGDADQLTRERGRAGLLGRDRRPKILDL
jgi:hypothetical protein